MSCAGRAGPARLAALALLTCSLWPARADNASQEYYTALINVTVQEPGRGAPLTFRIDRGRYGLDSPKAEVRGQVLAPLPLHGGESGPGAAGGGRCIQRRRQGYGSRPRLWPWLSRCALPGRRPQPGSRLPSWTARPAPVGTRLQERDWVFPFFEKRLGTVVFAFSSLFAGGH